MSTEKEKYIGESLIREEPGKKLKLKIGDKVIKKKHLSDEVYELFNDVDDLQNQIDSLEVAGIALSNEYGNDPYIGISQKKLTESYNEQTAKNAQYNEILDEHTTELDDTYRKSETYSKEQLDNMITTPEQEYVTVAATVSTTSVTDVLPETGEADTIYRVGNWDGTQYDEGGYTEYAWDGTQYVQLSVKEPGIDEVPTEDSNNLVKSGGIFPLKKTLDNITEGSGNLWTYGDQSFTRSISFNLDTPIQSGTYTLSAIVTSTGTDSTESRLLLLDDEDNSAIFQIGRNVRASATTTIDFVATKCIIYAETGGNTSVGDYAVWSNIQLEVGSTATDYKPDKTAIDYKARDAVESTEQNTESLFNNYVCKNIQEVTSFSRSSGYINKPTVGSVWTDVITANAGYNYISGGIDVSAYNTFDGYIIISTPTNESNAAYWGFADSSDNVVFTARNALSSAYTRYNEETEMYELVVKISGDKFFYSNKVLAVANATFKLLYTSIVDNKVLTPQNEKSIVKYVSAEGDNSNDGNSPASPYATMAKALAEGAQTIILAKGSYTESFRPTGVNLRIIGNGAEFTAFGNIMYFTNSHVEIEGVKITATGEGGSCFYFKNCTGTVTDCYAGSNLYMGFRISGSKMTFIRCVAENASVDGFNGHDYTADGVDYICDCTFIDCVAKNCGDDGLSFHERGKMHVFGGEFCGCTSTGIAPHNVCDAEIRNAYIHDNGSNGSSGIEAEKSDSTHTYDGEKGRVMSFGNLIIGNGGYGINVEGYTYFSVKDSFDANTSGTIHADGSDADVHEF